MFQPSSYISSLNIRTELVFNFLITYTHIFTYVSLFSLSSTNCSPARMKFARKKRQNIKYVKWPLTYNCKVFSLSFNNIKDENTVTWFITAGKILFFNHNMNCLLGTIINKIGIFVKLFFEYFQKRREFRRPLVCLVIYFRKRNINLFIVFLKSLLKTFKCVG